MKQLKFLKYALPFIAAVLTFTFASCSDDDDDSGLRCNPSRVAVEVGSTMRVKVSGGTKPYTATSGNTAVVTIKVEKDSVYVTGVKEGTAAITIKDAGKLTTTLSVTVKAKAADLTLSKTSATAAVGKQDTVLIKSGTAPYTISVKDSKIAVATIKDTKAIIKGLKVGSTVVTVTDKNKKTANIQTNITK